MLAVDRDSRDSSRKNEIDQGRAPDDGEGSRDGSGDSGKRKLAQREPESPGSNEGDNSVSPFSKKGRVFYNEMDADSPASYPKHVIVPTTDQGKFPPHGSDVHRSHAAFSVEKQGAAQVLTPDSIVRGRPGEGSYDSSTYGYPRQNTFPDVYRAPSYTNEMDYNRPYGTSSGHPDHENFARPRRWACDYCNVATFLSYEEACAHEEACSRRHHETQYLDSHHPPRPPTAGYYHGAVQHQGTGLGALYHASQEVVTPPTPHNYRPNRWGTHGPPLPVLPHEQSYYRQGYYDVREDPHYHDPHYYSYPSNPHQPYHHPHHPPQEYPQKRLRLALPSDRDSLSDRQCFVRTEMVEIFAATDKDVSARHSKGAQKLNLGQVGIRCIYCSHLRPRDRAERAVCFPSSISRIYQTVADMQRFHFEQCRHIPEQVLQVYKKLKTTRPRGVGSPQTYWISSAKTLGLADTGDGIRFDNDAHQQQRQASDMSVSTP